MCVAGSLACTTGVIVGCAVSAAVVCGAAAAGIGVSIQGNKDAAAAAKKQFKAQRSFEDKQLKLQKNDNARQAILQRNQLRKQRAQVMTSVSFNNVMSDRANLESTKTRRENAMEGAGLEAKRTSMPARQAYAYGKVS